MAASQAPPVPPFSIDVLPDREQVTVVPVGDLDLSRVDELDREVRELRAGFQRVTVDLSQVRLMDSSGLRVLLGLRNDARRDGHHLALRPGPRGVQRIFELTATRDLFDWAGA